MGGRKHAQHLEAGNLAGVLGRLALRVVEVGGHRDDRVRDGATHVCLRRLLHLTEDESTRLRGRVLIPRNLHPRIAIVGLDDLVGHCGERHWNT